jgi:hypothetical protein
MSIKWKITLTVLEFFLLYFILKTLQSTFGNLIKCKIPMLIVETKIKFFITFYSFGNLIQFPRIIE